MSEDCEQVKKTRRDVCIRSICDQINNTAKYHTFLEGVKCVFIYKSKSVYLLIEIGIRLWSNEASKKKHRRRCWCVCILDEHL